MPNGAPREPWPGSGSSRIGPAAGAVAIRVFGEGVTEDRLPPRFQFAKNAATRVESVSGPQKRISGPLLERIDIHLQVPRIPHEQLAKGITRIRAIRNPREMVERSRHERKPCTRPRVE